MKKKVVIIIVAAIITIGVSYGIIISLGKPYYEVETRVEKVKEEESIGWVRVQGTNIDYPVISSYRENIDEKVDDFAWINTLEPEGEIFDRVLLYGHNLLNLSSTPKIADSNHTRFEQLMSFAYHDFAEENQYIQYSDSEQDYLFEIYSVSLFDKFELDESVMMDEETKAEYIQDTLDISIYDYGINPDATSPLITLVTCTRMLGSTTLYQFRIDAVLVDDESYKKNITKTENYDIIEEKINYEDVVSNEV